MELRLTKGAACHVRYSVTSHLPRTAQHCKKTVQVPISLPVKNFRRVAVACSLFLAFSPMPEIQKKISDVNRKHVPGTVLNTLRR